MVGESSLLKNVSKSGAISTLIGNSSIFLYNKSSTPLLFFSHGILDNTVNMLSYKLWAFPYKCSSMSLINLRVTGTSVAYYAPRLSII